MSSPTFRFSQETYQFFRENQENLDFIRPPAEAVEASGLVWTTHGSGTQYRFLDNGKLEVALVTVLDDDVEEGNGRIFLKDFFVVDQDGKVPEHSRKIEYNNLGEDSEYWQRQVQLFQEKHTVQDKLLEKYKNFVGEKLAPRATLFTNPFNRSFWETFKGLGESDQSLLLSWGTAVEENKIPIVLNFKDPKSQYSVEFRGGRIEIRIRTAVIAKKDRRHLAFVEDRFALDVKSHEVLDHQRNWYPVAQTLQDKTLAEWLVKLNAAPKPDLQTAKNFMKGMMPFFEKYSGPVLELNKQRAESLIFDSLDAPPPNPPSQEKAPADGRAQALILVAGIASERIAGRVDESKGWLGGTSLDGNVQQGTLQQVLTKVQGVLKGGTEQSLLHILDGLELSGPEAQVRDQLVKDRMVRAVSFIADETDPESRAKEYLNLIRRDLMGVEQLPGSAQLLATHLKDHAPKDSKVWEEAKIIRDFFEGKSNAATSLEMQAPLLMNHVFTPETLAAFYVGGLAGSAAEATAYRGLRSLGWVKGTSRVLNGLRLGLGAGSGLAAESAAFAGAHQVAGSFRHDPNKMLDGGRFKTEWASMFLLLGMTRVAHLGTGWLQNWMSTTERALPKWMFQKKIPDVLPETVSSQPGSLKKILFPKTAPSTLAPPVDAMGRLQGLSPVPKLNLFGSTLAGTLNHGAGIWTMKEAMNLAPKLGLTHEGEPHRTATLTDSAVMYLQAVLGFKLANFTSGGALQQSIAKLKFTGKALGELPLPAEKSKRTSGPETLDEIDVVEVLTEVEGAPTEAAPEVGTEYQPPSGSILSDLAPQTRVDTNPPIPSSEPGTQLDLSGPVPPTEPSVVTQGTAPSDPFPLVSKSEPPTKPTQREVTMISRVEDIGVPKPESKPDPLPEAADITLVKGIEILQTNRSDTGRIRQAWENLWDQLIFGGRLTRLEGESRTALDSLQRALHAIGILRPAAEAWVRYAENKAQANRYLKGELSARGEELRRKGEALGSEKKAREGLEVRVAELEKTSEKFAKEAKEWKKKFEEEEVKGAQAVLARDNFSKTIDRLVAEREQANRFVKRLEEELKEVKDQMAGGDAANLGKTLTNLQEAVSSYRDGAQSIQELLAERTTQLDEANILLGELKVDLENARTLNQSLESGKIDLETRLGRVKSKLHTIPEIRDEKLDVDEGVDKLIKIVAKTLELYQEATSENAQLYEDIHKKEVELQETKDTYNEALSVGRQVVKGETEKREKAERAQSETAKELEIANRRLDNVRRENQTLEEDNRERRKKNERMKTSLSEAEQGRKAAEEQLKPLQDKIAELTQQVLAAQEGESQEIQRLRGELAQAKKDLFHEAGEREKSDQRAEGESFRAEAAEKEVARLRSKIEDLEKDLAQKDTHVANEVLEENRRVLEEIKSPKAPAGTAPFSLGRGELGNPLMLGYISFSPEGRITESKLGAGHFNPQEGAAFRPPPNNQEGRVFVVKSGDQVVWHNSRENLNGKQKTALADLAKEATQFQLQDPYSAQALMGEGLGPLALDLFHLLPDAQVTALDTGSYRANLQLVEGNGRLRLYHHGANAEWAINAKRYLSNPENGFQKMGPVEVEFIQPRAQGSQPPYGEVLFRFRVGDLPNIEALVEAFEYFGTGYGEKVSIQLMGRPDVSQAGPSVPPPPAGESEFPTIASPPRSGEPPKAEVPPAPKVPEIETFDMEDQATRVVDLAELPNYKNITLKTQVPQRGSVRSLPPGIIRTGEVDGTGVPSLHEKISEFGLLSGATYEGVDYEGGKNQDGFGRFFTPDGSLVMVGVDGAGGNFFGKEAAESILNSMGHEIPKGRPIEMALSIAGMNLTSRIDSLLLRMNEVERSDMERHPNFDPNAVVVAAQIRPPEVEGGDYTFQPYWAGDATVMVQRKEGNQWRLVYSSVEETGTQQLLGALKGNPEMYRAHFGEQDPELLQRTHDYSSQITNTLKRGGPEKGLRVLPDGIIVDPSEVVKLSDGSLALRLKAGDRVVMGSDGLMENKGRRQQILDIADAGLPGEPLAEPYLREVHARQEALAEARKNIDSVVDGIVELAKKRMGPKEDKVLVEHSGMEVLVTRDQFSTGSSFNVYSSGERHFLLSDVLRAPIQLEGRNLYVNYAGHVFDSIDSLHAMDHVKSDNFFVQVLEFNPEGLKTRIIPAIKQSPRGRLPRLTPAEAPSSKRGGPPYVLPPIKPPPKRPGPMPVEENSEMNRKTTAMINLVEGDVYPLRVQVGEDSRAIGAIKKEAGDMGWVVKLIDPNFPIEVLTQFEGNDPKARQIPYGKTLKQKGEIVSLSTGIHRLKVNGVITEVQIIDEGHAIIGTQSMEEALTSRDAVPLISEEEIRPELPLPLYHRKSPLKPPLPGQRPHAGTSSPLPPPPSAPTRITTEQKKKSPPPLPSSGPDRKRKKPPLPPSARARTQSPVMPEPVRPSAGEEPTRITQKPAESPWLVPPPVEYAAPKPPQATGYEAKSQVLSWGTARRIVLGNGGLGDSNGMVAANHDNFRYHLKKNLIRRQDFVILSRENVTEKKVKLTNTSDQVLWITQAEGQEPTAVQPGTSAHLFPGQRVTFGDFNFTLSFE